MDDEEDGLLPGAPESGRRAQAAPGFAVSSEQRGSRWRRLIGWIGRGPRALARKAALLPRFFEWCVSLAEPLVALSLVAAGMWLLFKIMTEQTTEKQLELLTNHWPVFLVLLLPLVYRPIRAFLNEVEEAGPFKRKPKRVEPGKEQGE